MRQFDFYEFAGIFVPGAVFISGALVIVPGSYSFLESSGLSFGEFGLLVVLAYGFGHLVQSIGNFIEWVWWRLMGGMPTDWVRSGKRPLISQQQLEAVKNKLTSELHLSIPDSLTTLSKKEWYSLVRQVYAQVSKAGNAARIDTFNGNYGINRGMASALFALILLAFLIGANLQWQVYAVMGILFLVALLRMHRFGVHYGRELFVQFLTK